MKRNTFEEICYQLNKCNCTCKSNKITCVREVLDDKIKKDHNEFLKIKAEARASDINGFTKIMLSYCAILIAIISVFIGTIEGNDPASLIEKGIMLLIAVVFVIHCIRETIKWSFTRTWREYVIVVLEEMEKDEDYFKKD
ncbi:hypothetical protein [Anaerosporobacter sp.]|uniref:hypothetical protein n=1 Tax=Anaerosporobacter sp. TaxID=1872529 RepID=UPI00286EDA14|nr:hypothetical protein [Anaerosporobacter sp.]